MPESTAAEVVERQAVAYSDLTYSEPQQMVVHQTGVPGLAFIAGTTAQEGLKVQKIDARTELEASRPNPNRAIGKRQVSELLSFLDELQRRPLEKGVSTLWGDYKAGLITAVYNDHASAAAGWRDDTAVLKFVPDLYWAKWKAISGEWFGQEELGDLLEELLPTVISPDQADLLEIVNSIRASSRGVFENKIDRSVGSQNLTYTHETTASAGSATKVLEVPKTIAMSLRPWEGHVEAYRIEAWFRLRVNNGVLGLQIKLKPTTEVERQAWTDIVGRITAAVDIPVLSYRETR